MPAQREYPPSSYVSPHPPAKQFVGWWAIGSLAAGALTLSFLPAAILDGGNWVDKLWTLSPVWATCAFLGIVAGIRGTQKQRYASKLQRGTALAGTLLSLFAFVLLTVIAVVMSG